MANFLLICLIVITLFLVRNPPRALAWSRVARAGGLAASRRPEIAVSDAGNAAAVEAFATKLRREAERVARSGGVARGHYQGWNCNLSSDPRGEWWCLSLLTVRERPSTPESWEVAGAVALALGAQGAPITPAVRTQTGGVLVLRWRECGAGMDDGRPSAAGDA